MSTIGVYIVDEPEPHFELMTAERAKEIGAKPGPKVRKPAAKKTKKKGKKS